MMSSNDSNDLISECLRHGAKDYIMKPLRLPILKNLSNYFKNCVQTTSTSVGGLNNYKQLRELGKGAAGSVTLVERISDGQQFALKKIALNLLNATEKRLAENEVQLLKVLFGPTIIRYYESYTDRDNIYIIMEYADGGNLSEKIKKLKDNKQNFPKDTILDWIAQITIGIMIMHSKKILHRDIKSQNMFIANNVVKIGDFGISKELATFNDLAKTSCGTPYFMSPEVIRGEHYDKKADMWALGCVGYELASLKKPFESENIKDLFKKILNDDYDSLPPNTDVDVKLMISTLLCKDSTKRPSVWEFASTPVIKKRIQDFAQQHNCEDVISSVFQISTSSKKNEEDKKGNKKNNQQCVLLEKAADYCEILRKNISLKDYKIGWFQSEKGCAKGADLVEYLVEKQEFNTENAIDMLQAMVDKNLIYEVSKNPNFSNSDRAFYKFHADRQDLPVNMINNIFTGYPRKPIEVSIDLLEAMDSVLSKIKSKNENNETEIDSESALKLEEFSKYLYIASELSKVSLNSMTKKEKMLFFLNVYQGMFMHYIFKETNLEKKKKSVIKLFKSLLYSEKKKFEYNIADQNYTLEIIKHVILRGNRKPPNEYFKLLKASDPRAQILQIDLDPRVLFVAKDIPEISDTLYIFKSVNDLNDQLNGIVQEYVNSSIVFDSYYSEIILPTIFSTYKEDFGKSDANVIRWLLEKEFIQLEDDQEEIISQIENKMLLVRYQEEEQAQE